MSEALDELTRVSQELGLYDMNPEDLYCEEHGRHRPCRPCLRDEKASP